MRASVLACCCFALASGATAARGQSTVTSPIVVPLHFTQLPGNGHDPPVYKLGIYVGIGAGSTPALFEFDTGGAGFYAAYSPNPGVSPWWGTATAISPPDSVTVLYDSGLQYVGNAAQAAVSLYASSGAATPLVTTAPTVQVGQMGQINKVNTANPSQVLSTPWDQNGSSTANPPIDSRFYGDFGMNLAANQIPNASGIVNLIAQLDYGPGVTPGYRIRADVRRQQAWIQIGLTAADTADPTAMYFPMNIDANVSAPNDVFPGTDRLYRSQQLFNANLSLTGGGEPPLASANVGLTPDTGASTTLHNTQNSPTPLPGQFSSFTAWSQQDLLGVLQPGLRFGLSGTTLANQPVSFFGFETSGVVDQGQVLVQNNRPDNPTYYLNTGISLFYDYDLIYDVQGGVIGLVAVPEPASFVLLTSAVLAGGAWLRMRRR
jgi:hypothetical protein